ncbi:FxsB family cyclophane-forming radical SAM/SPASM peptide maturase [Actinoplanes sp. NBRC 103695]|uniref:FxsB family cyclophane-forming radical SAM/SPASM peptide maturase n=1 Tax=Actinoplanes sp. NBRC 103695 TaxID=3032202 RepID=UPI0024A29EC3|nr:FxsB family cyclophane-forming radical SAM/SPASM peptide maturase [Actinoplanes sp. NBRC 103695]GLY99023.1 hypothetical protein Acsp02_62770 [Actinoplanes sp. NBRC 103695]
MSRTEFLQQFVLKVASRCDLGCDYCYVYRMADHSFATQPRFMSAGTIERTADRIAEHVTAHRLDRVEVAFHGGEPLLAGPDYFVAAARTIRDRLPGTRVDLLVQTHGGLLDESMLTALADHRITVGVSLDGGPDHHDRHRRRRDGGGTHEQTARGLALLTGDRFRPIFGGLLCVIDLANNPVEVYEALVRHRPPEIDFLLPHGNWSRPPPGRSGDSAAPYGAWLCAAFDRWYDASPPETTVRLFDDVIRLCLGRSARGEQIGLSPASFVVIDTDGALQQVDTLKSVRPGAAGTGLHVSADSMDDVLEHPGLRARRGGVAALCATCRECSVVRICGGGSYVHRWSSTGGFANPSVYCPDLQDFIGHVVRRVSNDLGPAR